MNCVSLKFGISQKKLQKLARKVETNFPDIVITRKTHDLLAFIATIPSQYFCKNTDDFIDTTIYYLHYLKFRLV